VQRSTCQGWQDSVPQRRGIGEKPVPRNSMYTDEMATLMACGRN